MLNSQRKYEEAKAMNKEVLNLRGEELGDEHPLTLDSMNYQEDRSDRVVV
jgi:hypothetical protein